MLTADIVDRFLPFARACLKQPAPRALPPLPAAAEAVLLHALAQASARTIVWVGAGAESLERMHRDLRGLQGRSVRLLYYPPWESLPTRDAAPDAEIAGCRLQTLHALGQPGPALVVTAVQAAMQRTLSPAALQRHTTVLEVGDEHEIETLSEALSRAGYRFGHEVVQKGEAAVRGGLLDVWPVTQAWPRRVEFFGPTVDSIRSFDPGTQRSRARLERAALPPAVEWPFVLGEAGSSGGLSAFLPPGAGWIWSDEPSLREHADAYRRRAAAARAGKTVASWDELRREARAGAEGWASAWREDTAVLPPQAPDLRPLAGVAAPAGGALEPDLAIEQRRRFLQRLAERARAGWTVLLCFDTRGALEHFGEQLPGETIETCVAPLSEGFASEALKLVVAAEPDLYGRRKRRGPRYDPVPGRERPDPRLTRRVGGLADMEPGELVVHVEHGLGRYEGLREIVFDGQRQEVLTIEYADRARLHVPVAHAHLLTRYVGVGRQRAALHRLGGRRWGKEKQAAEAAVRDLASSLLETQAQRELLTGHAFAPPSDWEREFAAAFPYRETPDQSRVIAEVEADMRRAKPMDRLVCGDAGYGKTEVAMRAAFKAAGQGKQTAVLVPTTVLAQQHYDTFRERLAGYPFRIEMLSRFRRPAERRTTLRGLAEGTVDMVIGTHALVQPGVRFKDLGLVIVDEEQRFGVAQKEHLKHLRRLVDVLTLTATPIPRTLYLSMTGARDMSLLQTPPRERMAIETVVTRNTEQVVREAVLRELDREGQVFYLHNRVMSIDWALRRLEDIVPEARIAVAHGQMSAAELAGVMHGFVAGQYDVLLCTTIIESGVDIPRANTILIDRADRFGIADLYQLRGRVGRSRHKAYAYLLLPSHGLVDADARKRIRAVQQHSGLSAGFSLAMRDLEIRGAGNLLGAAQSGHIAAIGFGLYCQLLRRTIDRLKGAPQKEVIDVGVKLDFLALAPAAAAGESAAALPYIYIDDERHRVMVYRRLAQVGSEDELAALRNELTDRFGPLPEPAARLLRVVALRLLCARKHIRRLETRDGKVMLLRYGDYLKHGYLFPRLQASSPDGKLEELRSLIETVDAWSRRQPGSSSPARNPP